jgi:hypothetical protein
MLSGVWVKIANMFFLKGVFFIQKISKIAMNKQNVYVPSLLECLIAKNIN